MLAVLLAVGALAVWRRRPASTAAVRQQEAQAEAAARKFMALQRGALCKAVADQLGR